MQLTLILICINAMLFLIMVVLSHNLGRIADALEYDPRSERDPRGSEALKDFLSREPCCSGPPPSVELVPEWESPLF